MATPVACFLRCSAAAVERVVYHGIESDREQMRILRRVNKWEITSLSALPKNVNPSPVQASPSHRERRRA